MYIVSNLFSLKFIGFYGKPIHPYKMNNLDCIELPPVRVPDMERIRTARRKRQQQLKRWYQYDKTMDKKQKRGITSSSPPPGSTAGGRRHFGLLRSIQFSQSVILLEAAARDDLDEGK